MQSVLPIVCTEKLRSFIKPFQICFLFFLFPLYKCVKCRPELCRSFSRLCLYPCLKATPPLHRVNTHLSASVLPHFLSPSLVTFFLSSISFFFFFQAECQFSFSYLGTAMWENTVSSCFGCVMADAPPLCHNVS